MDADLHLEAVCHALGLLLKELARERCAGRISEETFTETVLKIEAEHVTPGGFTLTASNTRDDWTVFKVRIKGEKETCAEFEFLPETGQFRQVGTACEAETAALDPQASTNGRTRPPPNIIKMERNRGI